MANELRGRLTKKKTREERADGWTCRSTVEQVLVDGDGSECGGCVDGGDWGLRHRGH